ncbi:hypothetical protein [Cryptosporangium minutisporangium]|uniref:Uncharacterized protein n=1 Tax=Cryptosporangium minutisporangium TaxID=113569 RepID=A0ABP6T7L7_9ACTN
MSRRQQRTTTLLLAVLVALTGFGPAPARAAQATMTFNGVLNVAGLLSSVTVTPAVVTVPAGSEVRFVNATSSALTVTVGGESTRLDPGRSAPMLFTGAERIETFSAAATAVNVPLVGSLTSSVGRITVLAMPSDATEPKPTIGPDAGGSPDSAPRSADDRHPTREPADATDGPGARSTQSGAVIPLPPGASSSVRPGASSTTRPSDGRDGPGGPEDFEDSDGAGVPGDDRPDSSDAKAADTEVSPVLPPFPGFSSTHDQLGLMVLLSAVVLVGLGAAAFRTVLAYRPVVEVGAHSQAARQAARKARTMRRKRS